MREWLFDARKKSGMTQAEVAKRLDISEAYYAYIENGQRQQNMDITLASKLSMIFSIPIDRIAKFEMKQKGEA